jgi:hypothetical protein
VRHIGVERRAEEGEAAGHGRLHVGAEAQRPPRHFRHAGKAAVELDGVECAPVAAAEFHRRLEHGVLGVALEEPVADQIVARLFREGAAPDVDQAVFGDASGARFRQARDQDRAAHIDGRIGHHQLGIGPGDQPVVRRRRRDLFRREAPLQPGVRILCRDI